MFLRRSEIKSVKVDNWGVFFLQKLQHYFNKTEYCDLTLQFKDNCQLKVHRLVLKACTDYFSVLEQTCDMIDDVLIMPNDLQADVIVPIVNFMYTGTLEFEVHMYGRLLKTAREMNMTVLLKLLEAHKRTVDTTARPTTAKQVPYVLNKNFNNFARLTGATSTPKPGTVAAVATKTTSNARPIMTSRGPATIKIQSVSRNIQQTQQPVAKQPPSTISYLRKRLPNQISVLPTKNKPITGPARYDYVVDEKLPDSFDSSFDSISYESKPLKHLKDESESEGEPSADRFDKLKQGFTNNTAKRPLTRSSNSGPPEKKPNLEEVKEYIEAQKERKEIAKEIDEDNEEFPEADDRFDDDEEEEPQTDKSGNKSGSKASTEKGNTSGGKNSDHTQIITDVLKKYAHLVKPNRNIKVKIMQSSTGGGPKKTITEKLIPAKGGVSLIKKPEKVQVTQKESTSGAVKPKQGEVKCIDRKTLNELIAKGAENTTGPWLCIRCGVNGRPISMSTYRLFRRHLVNIHKERIDPRLCEECGARQINKMHMAYHMLVKHGKPAPPTFNFPQCGDCDHIAIDQKTLQQHYEDDHTEKRNDQHECIYCNETFEKDMDLYSHIHENHKDQALKDGVIEPSDDDDEGDEQEKYVPNHPEAEVSDSGKKIKVIQEISFSPKQNEEASKKKLEPSSEAEALSNVASGIATSMAVLDSNEQFDTHDPELTPTQYIEAAMADVHGEFEDNEPVVKKKEIVREYTTKFLNEDGSELSLSQNDENDDLLQQLEEQTDEQKSQSEGDVEMKSNIQILSNLDDESTSFSEDINQQKPQDVEEMEVDEDEDKSAKLDDPESKKEQDLVKLKLIEELEGDWTETEAEADNTLETTDKSAEATVDNASIEQKSRKSISDEKSEHGASIDSETDETVLTELKKKSGDVEETDDVKIEKSSKGENTKINQQLSALMGDWAEDDDVE